MYDPIATGHTAGFRVDMTQFCESSDVLCLQAAAKFEIVGSVTAGVMRAASALLLYLAVG